VRRIAQIFRRTPGSDRAVTYAITFGVMGEVQRRFAAAGRQEDRGEPPSASSKGQTAYTCVIHRRTPRSVRWYG
jgi:hypothetical protein